MENQMSLIEIALEIMESSKEPLNIYTLIEETLKRKGVSDEDGTLAAKLYTDITISSKFVYMGDDLWDLKSRQSLDMFDKDGSSFINPDEEYTDKDDNYDDEDEDLDEDEDDLDDLDDEDEDEESDEDDDNDEDEDDRYDDLDEENYEDEESDEDDLEDEDEDRYDDEDKYNKIMDDYEDLYED